MEILQKNLPIEKYRNEDGTVYNSLEKAYCSLYGDIIRFVKGLQEPVYPVETAIVYQLYLDYCSNSDVEPLDRLTFTYRIKAITGWKRIQHGRSISGNTAYYFIMPKETNKEKVARVEIDISKFVKAKFGNCDKKTFGLYEKDFVSWYGDIVAFLSTIPENELFERPTIEVYNRYVEFCNQNGLEHLTRKKFTNRTQQLTGAKVKPKRIFNKIYQIYVRGADETEENFRGNKRTCKSI